MLLRYVEGNPVKADLESSTKDWLWSSHREVISKRKRLLIDEIPLELPMKWDRYVNEPLTDKEIERLLQSIKRQSPFGDVKWQIQVSNELGLESTLRSRGRPKEAKDGIK